MLRYVVADMGNEVYRLEGLTALSAWDASGWHPAGGESPLWRDSLSIALGTLGMVPAVDGWRGAVRPCGDCRVEVLAWNE